MFILDTDTSKVPNASPTAASASSDLYAKATEIACKALLERLSPYVTKAGSWVAGVVAAHTDRIDLCEHAFYATDLSGGKNGESRKYNYFTYGCAVAEVSVDLLTGAWHAQRVDLVMDIGCPINPAIDIGQIEGAFAQGLGWSCLEEVKWGDDAHPWIRKGHLHTKGPGTYKLPTASDMPSDFNVTVLDDVPNPLAVHSSKAVGEPPLFLGASVFFAIRDAVKAGNEGGEVWLDSPATPERIRMAVREEIAEMF